MVKMEIAEEEKYKYINDYDSILENINRGHKKIIKNIIENLNKEEKNLNNDKINYN